MQFIHRHDDKLLGCHTKCSCLSKCTAHGIQLIVPQVYNIVALPHKVDTSQLIPAIVSLPQEYLFVQTSESSGKANMRLKYCGQLAMMDNK